mgnify:CR=1 FL=1
MLPLCCGIMETEAKYLSGTLSFGRKCLDLSACRSSKYAVTSVSQDTRTALAVRRFVLDELKTSSREMQGLNLHDKLIMVAMVYG